MSHRFEPHTAGNAATLAVNRQSGVALIVSLLLLTVLTVIGASSMKTATLQLVMAGNSRFQEEAFQAAETGIDLVMAQRIHNIESPATLPDTLLGDGSYSTRAVVTFTQSTPVPDLAFSLGEGSLALRAFHFEIVAVGMGPRNAVSNHKQGFYVLGPGG